MALHWEFRAGKDFDFGALNSIWHWLDDMDERQLVNSYDWLDEFIDDFAEQINRLSDEGEDAFDHVDHLPEIVDRDAFDHEDDSIYNDQGEPDAPQVSRKH